jgi:plastocyanin domain-containing protein
MNNTKIIAGIASLGLLFGVSSGRAIGNDLPEAIVQFSPEQAPLEESLHVQVPHEMPSSESTHSGQFQRMEQPLSHRLAVTVGGLGLIGLELWWFLWSKPKSRKAQTESGVQNVTVVVDGGYEPSQIVVQAGQPVRLNFDRKDPSSCLEEVRFPDFHIAQSLPLNQVTAIEFTPEKPGKYEFTCGMNMFRGIVKVQPTSASVATSMTEPNRL